MEQNLVSDEELIKRINKALNDSRQEETQQVAEIRQDDSSFEKFHDVYETSDQVRENNTPSEVKIPGVKNNLVFENHYLSLQLQAEKKKSKELQSKFKLFEHSVKYFERLNKQLETIKQAVDDEIPVVERDIFERNNLETMQKIRPKNIHTTTSGIMTSGNGDDSSKETPNFSEPNNQEPGNKQDLREEKEEVAFRDAEDFKQLEQGLEIIKDKNMDLDSDAEKVFITKTEKRCLEDIGNIAARTRAPLDDKHQKYFERDRRRFANSIIMPEVQTVEKADSVPLEIISKTKETPVNITSTELDGLRSYLLQLKELIARRETAWARTTERDYNQRVEITRFKNEVSHLRMLCEKRQKDIKERDQIIFSKDEEIRELQKRIQGLRNAIMKLEKKDDRFIDTVDSMTNETLENSQIVQKSYNAMKRQSMMNRASITTSINTTAIKQPANATQPPSRNKDVNVNVNVNVKKLKNPSDKSSLRKVKGSESTSNDEDGKVLSEKKQKVVEKSKVRHRSDSLHKTKETYDKVDEKLQKVEEMLHNEVLKGAKKPQQQSKWTKNHGDVKSFIKNHLGDFSLKKKTPSNSKMRQEMLTAMTGLSGNSNLGLRTGGFLDLKKNHATAAVIANALLAARKANVFNY